MIRRAALVVLVCGAVLLAGCSSGDSGGSSTTEAEAAAPSPAKVEQVLTALADDVVIPNYVALDDAMTSLRTATDELCATPSEANLTAAQDAWKEAIQAWQRTRASALGPAMDRRLMSEVAFAARSANVEKLLSGTDPVDAEGMAEKGAAVKGLYAVEIALFDDGSEVLATPEGARRCQYTSTIVGLSADAIAGVAEEWTDGDARKEFVAGSDGDPNTTVAGLLNEVSRRLNEIDTTGLRDMAEADSPEDLNITRSDGPAAFKLADRRASLAGASQVIGDGTTGLSALASKDLADRLVKSRDQADDAMAALPDSVTAAFEQPDDIDTASKAVAALKVLASTEVASELGVTITFSDSDGDS